MNKGLINDVVSNEKKKRYAVVVSFLVLMICITGSTYAYFALTASNNSITGTVGGGSLSLTVSKVFPTNNNSNMIPQLESTLEDAISDEYSCVDDNGNVICQVYSATVQNVGSTSAELSGTISFTGIDNIPNLKWMRITDSRTIGEYDSYTATTNEALFEEGRVFDANGSATYYFVFWIDEIGEAQTDNGTFRAIINFDSSTGGLSSTVRPLLTTYINDLYNDGSSINTVNIAGDSANQAVSLNSTQGLMYVNQGDTYGEEYRYYGATPNNYVSFNGELWRIISSSKVFSSESDTTGSQRVRLIRDESIGNHAWDPDTDGYRTGTDNMTSNWVTATLNTTLNGPYYNKVSGICYKGEIRSVQRSASECDYLNGEVKGLSSESRGLIEDSLWYLGGYGYNTDIYADDFYNAERNNAGYGSYPTRWVGKVGLMYTSDYTYATDLSKCLKFSGQYGSDTTNCVNTNWLKDEISQWLITPMFDWDSGVFDITTSGSVSGYDGLYTENANGIHPVVVLKSNVKVMGGDGSSGNPYTLGLDE